MRLLTALCLCAYLLIDSENAILRARDAMTLWYASVAPAMFPFFALLPALTDEDALSVYSRMFGKSMKKLFRISGASASPALVGLLAGSPAGSTAVLRAFLKGAISRKDARVLSALATGASPVFIVSSVGEGMMNDVSLGVKLLACTGTASFLTAFLVSRFCSSGENEFYVGEPSDHMPGAIREAVIGVLTVAGYMTAFSVFAGWLNPNVYAFFEVSGGCFVAAQKKSFVMAAAVIGFGGLCLTAQNIRNLGQAGVKAHEIVLMKAVTGLFSASLGAAFSVLPSFSFRMPLDAYRTSCVLALMMALLCVIYRLFKRRRVYSF